MSTLRRLPIRWRLALTSAALTFAILAVFAVVVGMFTTDRVRDNFDNDLRATAADLQDRVRVKPRMFGGIELERGTAIAQIAAAGGGQMRLILFDGSVIEQTPGAPNLGPLAEGTRDAGGYRVVSRPVFGGRLAEPVAYVQYGKPLDDVNATVARIRLFLGLGVLGGAGLALLAGLAVARRAMGPIADLTAAARSVAKTRDPAVALPHPEAEDEVADLSRTLEEMLGALDSARSETETTLDRQREFVADASHELRTPLTSVLANLELLAEELEGEQAEIADSALRSSRRMRRLVADLLLLARADAGRAAPRRPTDLGAVARAAAAEAAPLAPDHSLAVEADGGLTVDGAPDDLHRLCLNLIENALCHTPPATNVAVTVRREEGEVVLEVADDGPGIASGLRDRLFDRFVRGGGDSGRAGTGGSGLGLAIVQAVAEGHGGSVELAAEGAGTRFVVRLPAAEGAAAPQTSTTTGSTMGRRLSRS
jgi:two-component system, OmpR family, sensor kinase